MLHVYSQEKFMLELRILDILKLHRKTVLQQTHSSDTPTSGTPFFFYLVWRSALNKKKGLRWDLNPGPTVEREASSGWFWSVAGWYRPPPTNVGRTLGYGGSTVYIYIY